MDMSRIDYSRIYTVENNVKAMAFGWIHEDCEKDLFYAFREVIFGSEWASDNRSARDQSKDESGEGDGEEGEESDSDDEDGSDKDELKTSSAERGAAAPIRIATKPPPSNQISLAASPGQQTNPISVRSSLQGHQLQAAQLQQPRQHRAVFANQARNADSQRSAPRPTASATAVESDEESDEESSDDNASDNE